jgi:hypothetical protein
MTIKKVSSNDKDARIVIRLRESSQILTLTVCR